MNRNRVLMIGIVALALSGIVTFWAYRNMAAGPVGTTQIVVAKKNLPLGMRLTADDVTTVSWPKDLLPKGSIGDVKQVEERGVIVEMLQNDPVLEDKLVPKGGVAGLTTTIPNGMRAVSVKVDDVIGVAGWVLPGTYVDVIATGQPTQNGDPTTKIIVENVKVLTADQNLQTEKDKDTGGKAQSSKVVTLLVSPDDAQKIALAGDGRIQLALRNPLDVRLMDPAPIKKPELYLGHTAPPPPPPNTGGPAAGPPARPYRRVVREPQIREIVVILGGKEQKVKVEGKP